MQGVMYWTGVVFWSWWAFWLGLLALVLLRRRLTGPGPRRPGYLTLPASNVQSRVGSYTTAGMNSNVAFSSSPTEPGPGSAGVATRPTPQGPNKPIAPTSSGNATVEAGANGQPPADAAFDDHGNLIVTGTWDTLYPPWPNGQPTT